MPARIRFRLSFWARVLSSRGLGNFSLIHFAKRPETRCASLSKGLCAVRTSSTSLTNRCSIVRPPRNRPAYKPAATPYNRKNKQKLAANAVILVPQLHHSSDDQKSEQVASNRRLKQHDSSRIFKQDCRIARLS